MATLTPAQAAPGPDTALRAWPDQAVRIGRLVGLCGICAWVLCGCASAAAFIAGQLAAGTGAAALGQPSPQELSVPGLDGAPIDYPIGAVYHALLSVAEADGRKLVESDEATYTLRVSYPFSLVHNNWGGEITVSCVAEGQGTRVGFQNDGHDAGSRVAKIEANMLEDALRQLRQPTPASHGAEGDRPAVVHHQ